MFTATYTASKNIKTNIFSLIKHSRLSHLEQKTSENVTILEKKVPHSKSIEAFFRKNKEIAKLRQYIPAKYLQLSRGFSEHMYLISPSIAKTIVSHIKPVLHSGNEQIICETNAGLGLIATELLELLEDGTQLVRLYEPCPEFRNELKDFSTVYPKRVELFTKDIFYLSRYAYMDQQDRGNRVESLLKNVPKRSWSDEPVMVIIGPMPKLSFLKYLLVSLALQNNIVTYGRMQLFVLMKPKDFAVLNASPKDNLSAYKNITILFQLLCDYELLDKFSRSAFLPWESLSKTSRNRYPSNFEPDKMYFVKIDFKKTLPVATSDLLPLFYFVRQFYGKGNNKIIPTLEKWIPGCGVNIIVPKLNHAEYFDDIDIFTSFRELTPNQILSVFKETINYPSYRGSNFTTMIENDLLRYETIETNLAESLLKVTKNREEMEEKLDTT